jgi:hypothetical protein
VGASGGGLVCLRTTYPAWHKWVEDERPNKSKKPLIRKIRKGSSRLPLLQVMMASHLQDSCGPHNSGIHTFVRFVESLQWDQHENTNQLATRLAAKQSAREKGRDSKRRGERQPRSSPTSRQAQANFFLIRSSAQPLRMSIRTFTHREVLCLRALKARRVDVRRRGEVEGRQGFPRPPHRVTGKSGNGFDVNHLHAATADDGARHPYFLSHLSDLLHRH